MNKRKKAKKAKATPKELAGARLSIDKACADLVSYISAEDGTIPITFTVRLHPIELILLGRKAFEEGSTINQALEDYILESPEGHGGGLLDFLQRYEAELPQKGSPHGKHN